MSVSDNSEKLNNCDTCQDIKNREFDEASTAYLSYDEDDTTSSTYSHSLGKTSNFESLHLDLSKKKSEKHKSTSRGTIQQNKTFSSEKIREIDRSNAKLVDKILYHSRRPNQYKSTSLIPAPKVTSAEINRRRHQEKISRENEILLKKIQSVKPCVKYT